MQNCPNFWMNILFHIFCQIFAKLFAKKTWRGAWQIWNLACKTVRSGRDKKLKLLFCQTSPSWSKYLQILFSIFSIKQIFGEVFISHVQLVLKIFITSCLFLIELLLVLSKICWLKGLQSTCTEICKRKWKCTSNIFVWTKWTERKWDMKIEFSYWHFPKEEAA